MVLIGQGFIQCHVQIFLCRFTKEVFQNYLKSFFVQAVSVKELFWTTWKWFLFFRLFRRLLWILQKWLLFQVLSGNLLKWSTCSVRRKPACSSWNKAIQFVSDAIRRKFLGSSDGLFSSRWVDSMIRPSLLGPRHWHRPPHSSSDCEDCWSN